MSTGTLINTDTSTGMFTGATVTVAGPIAADEKNRCAVKGASQRRTGSGSHRSLRYKLLQEMSCFTLNFTGTGSGVAFCRSRNVLILFRCNGTRFYYSN